MCKFCSHVHSPNHYIQITSQFSVFWIFRHFCNHSPQSLHNNNLEIFVFAIFGNFGEISRPNVRKLRGHSVYWPQHLKIKIHSLLVLLQNGWSFVVFPLQSYGLTYNFTFRAIDIYISIWKMLKYYTRCAKDFLGQFNFCCCQVVWQKWTNQIKIFLFHISINLFRSWHTFIKNKLMRISLFLMIVCQLRNKFMLVRNKNILIWFVHFCQTNWQQH